MIKSKGPMGKVKNGEKARIPLNKDKRGTIATMNAPKARRPYNKAK